jgi:23S rRNA (cytidine1920-2'-O)/16S rRNA (cytidine1409-2'-O)-methyltransferase
MKRQRLDQAMVQLKLAASRSQAENYIKLGYVEVNGARVTKPGYPVGLEANIRLSLKEQYVSRAALKLAGAADQLGLEFKDKLVLDVGSSTGGFSEFALKNGAKKVIAVDVGSDQLHSKLRHDQRIELYEQTDIRQVEELSEKPEIVLVDVSFISLRVILPHVKSLVGKSVQIAALCKPQFEAGESDVNKGIVKNATVRRRIFKGFEDWAKPAKRTVISLAARVT